MARKFSEVRPAENAVLVPFPFNNGHWFLLVKPQIS